MKGSQLRRLWVLPLVASLFLLGYWREIFFISFDRVFHQFLTNNIPPSIEKYPSNLVGIITAAQHSSKWIGSLVYTSLFAIHAAAIVFFAYQSKRLAIFTLGIYLVLIVGCFLLILVGNTLGSYVLGYGLSQHLKKLLQSPFFALLLIPAFRLLQTNRTSR